MTCPYKQYPVGHFDIITVSPACLWQSGLKRTWIDRNCKSIYPRDIITKEHIDNDIDTHGKPMIDKEPMIDKVFKIIDYFKPKYWWIENPATGRTKNYIIDEPYYDVDYCKCSDWAYKEKTRFWTNIKDFKLKTSKSDYDTICTIKSRNKRNKKYHKNLV